jgi:hypothetical protein
MSNIRTGRCMSMLAQASALALDETSGVMLDERSVGTSAVALDETSVTTSTPRTFLALGGPPALGSAQLSGWKCSGKVSAEASVAA